MRNATKWVNQPEYEGFLKNAIAIKGSVTPKVFPMVLLVFLYSITISLIYYVIPHIALPIGPLEYAGLVMGLVLVFRVNAGYDRWWEARKIWGGVVNDSRNLAIMLSEYPTPYDADWKMQMTNYVAALPFLMKNHLRGRDAVDEVKHLLDKTAFDIVSNALHRPNALSALIAKGLKDAVSEKRLDSFAFLKAEEIRANVINAEGACERILTTPMPFVMAVKSRRFILLFLLALPFALIDLSVIINPLVTGLVGYALFALDQIGVELQNPFAEKHLSHLPLNVICRTIENNIREIQSLEF